MKASVPLKPCPERDDCRKALVTVRLVGLFRGFLRRRFSIKANQRVVGAARPMEGQSWALGSR